MTTLTLVGSGSVNPGNFIAISNCSWNAGDHVFAIYANNSIQNGYDTMFETPDTGQNWGHFNIGQQSWLSGQQGTFGIIARSFSQPVPTSQTGVTIQFRFSSIGTTVGVIQIWRLTPDPARTPRAGFASGWSLPYDLPAKGTSTSPSNTFYDANEDMVIVGMNFLRQASFINDTDTTGGPWTARTTTSVGSGTGGVSVSLQTKVVSIGYEGNIVYDGSINSGTSSDWGMFFNLFRYQRAPYWGVPILE